MLHELTHTSTTVDAHFIQKLFGNNPNQPTPTFRFSPKLQDGRLGMITNTGFIFDQPVINQFPYLINSGIQFSNLLGLNNENNFLSPYIENSELEQTVYHLKRLSERRLATKASDNLFPFQISVANDRLTVDLHAVNFSINLNQIGSKVEGSLAQVLFHIDQKIPK